MFKDTNPKTAAGQPKPAMEFVPPVATLALALAHRHGAEKYGAFNWRDQGVSETTYYSAMHRHLGAWFDGEDIDTESGISHLAMVMACCAILLDAESLGKLKRDRPLPGMYGRLLPILTAERQRQQGAEMGATASQDFSTSTYATVRTGALKPGDIDRLSVLDVDLKPRQAPATFVRDFRFPDCWLTALDPKVEPIDPRRTFQPVVRRSGKVVRDEDAFDRIPEGLKLSFVNEAGAELLVKRVETKDFVEAAYTSSRGRRFVVQGATMTAGQLHKLRWRISNMRFDFVAVPRPDGTVVMIEPVPSMKIIPQAPAQGSEPIVALKGGVWEDALSGCTAPEVKILARSNLSALLLDRISKRRFVRAEWVGAAGSTEAVSEALMSSHTREILENRIRGGLSTSVWIKRSNASDLKVIV